MANASYRLDFIETLYRFDEPVLFVARAGMMPALFLKTDETDHGNEYLCCYIASNHLEGLKDGRISLRGVYEAQSDVSIVTTDFHYQVERVVPLSIKAPQVLALLPEPGVGILPRMGECPDVLQEKDSLISVYFKGAGLERDRIGYQTLMDLLSKVQRFAKNMIAPELRKLRSSTFDFTVGDPALGSLMISIKEPEFDLAKLRQNEKRRDLTREELTGGVERNRADLFADIESLASKATSSPASEDAYYAVRDLLPSEDTPFQSVMFSTNDPRGFRSVSIDTSRAEEVRRDYEPRQLSRATRSGIIVEINADSGTCLLRSPQSYRVTTCAFDAETFDELQQNRKFRIGSRLQVTGEFLKRTRRDYLTVHRVDLVEGP